MNPNTRNLLDEQDLSNRDKEQITALFDLLDYVGDEAVWLDENTNIFFCKIPDDFDGRINVLIELLVNIFQADLPFRLGIENPGLASFIKTGLHARGFIQKKSQTARQTDKQTKH